MGDLTIGQVVGWLSSLGLVGGAGWLLRKVFERRRERAKDTQEEAKAEQERERARQLHLSNDGAELANFETLSKRLYELTDEFMQETRRTRECESREVTHLIRVTELEGAVRSLTDTLKGEIQKTAAKEAELVELRQRKSELEDQLRDAKNFSR